MDRGPLVTKILATYDIKTESGLERNEGRIYISLAHSRKLSVGIRFVYLAHGNGITWDIYGTPSSSVRAPPPGITKRHSQDRHSRRLRLPILPCLWFGAPISRTVSFAHPAKTPFFANNYAEHTYKATSYCTYCSGILCAISYILHTGLWERHIE